MTSLTSLTSLTYLTYLTSLISGLDPKAKPPAQVSRRCGRLGRPDVT